MVILISQNKITDFFMILAWACPLKSVIAFDQVGISQGAPFHEIEYFVL